MQGSSVNVEEEVPAPEKSGSDAAIAVTLVLLLLLGGAATAFWWVYVRAPQQTAGLGNPNERSADNPMYDASSPVPAVYLDSNNNSSAVNSAASETQHGVAVNAVYAAADHPQHGVVVNAVYAATEDPEVTGGGVTPSYGVRTYVHYLTRPYVLLPVLCTRSHSHSWLYALDLPLSLSYQCHISLLNQRNTIRLWLKKKLRSLQDIVFMLVVVVVVVLVIRPQPCLSRLLPPLHRWIGLRCLGWV